MVDKRVLQTIIAEAGGDPQAMQAVSAVINNRANATGRTPLQVVSQPGQFEGYSNPGPVVARQLNDSTLLQRAEDAYNGVASGAIPDPTNGGTMYHASYVTPYWASSANQHGAVNIGGNIFYRGAGSAPKTAVAAINALVPNPQQRPSALAYAETPSAVRAFSVNPDGSPASLWDALIQRYGSASIVPRGTSSASLYGNISLPEAMPMQRPSSILPQQLVSHPVQTVSIDPYTGNPSNGNSAPSLQDALNAKAQRLASGEEQWTPTNSIVPRLNYPSGVMKTTTAQAGNVALPPGVVPQQAMLDMNAAAASQMNGSGSPDDRSIVPSNPFAGSYAGGSGVSRYIGPSNAISVGKDESQLPELPVTAYVPQPTLPAVSAINDATNPFAGAFATGEAGGIQPSGYSPRALPLTSFNTVNPGSQIVPRVGSYFNTTPVGHLTQLLTGQPVQGGLLGMLFGGGSSGSSTPVTDAVNTPAAGSGYLQAQGMNTSNMIAPQIANNLRNSILGNGGHGSFN